jgi:hypothetical protein
MTYLSGFNGIAHKSDEPHVCAAAGRVIGTYDDTARFLCSRARTEGRHRTTRDRRGEPGRV